MAEGRVVGIDLGTTNSLVAYMEGDRPVVIRDSSEVEVNLSVGTESVFLTLDGQTGIPMQPGDQVRMKRAAERLKLIQPQKKSYFEILHSKLKWGET